MMAIQQKPSPAPSGDGQFLRPGENSELKEKAARPGFALRGVARARRSSEGW